MVRFTYTAEKGNGEVYKGVAEAADRFDLYTVIRREGGRVVSVSEENGGSVWSIAYWNSKFGSISQYERILFARNLSAMLSAGLPLSRALAVQERQTKNKKLAEVMAQIAGDVRRGDTLHSALAKFPLVFSSLFVAMVRAGEEGGDLAASLGTIADQLERTYTLTKKIRGALIYPAIIVVAIIGIGTLMMIEVVPTLAATFEEMGAELPASTQVIIAISNFLVEYTFLAGLLVVVVGGGSYFALQTTLGQRGLDTLFLAMPLIGNIVREVNAARTARTLSSLLSSGVDLLTSLEIVHDVVQNSYFRAVLKTAKQEVARGEPLSATFAKNEHLYPAFVGEMIAVGEETGQLTEMMKRLSQFYEDEVDRQTKDLSTVIEPFLMVAIGGAVGFFAVAMISPIYQLSENI